MDVYQILNRDIVCECGRTHRCDVETLKIGKGVLDQLDELIDYKNILLVADCNTYPLCGEKVEKILGSKIKAKHVFQTEGLLVPNEESCDIVSALATPDTDLVLGIGSGVINDICKYVAWNCNAKSGIIATAPSMDGFASSGAAMILGGMKVTVTTRAPEVIIGDVDILKDAPMEMIAAGYADIIGKYSSLNDWKLANLINGEHLCPFLYNVTLTATNEVRSLAKKITERDEYAIGKLMETLVASGISMTLNTNTRPGSGSEHHLSHFFEITGLIEDKPYFLHGTDVGYSTIVVADIREKIAKIDKPIFNKISDEDRLNCYKKIYHDFAGEVDAIQKKFGFYNKDLSGIYTEKWDEIRAILKECPTANEVREMLVEVGFDLDRFESFYGAEKIRNSTFFGKDLKDRYSVLWIYFQLFIDEKVIREILE
ncbi:MAG: sn-glycerol-1-phosphate dehydrogenase [Clostridia bacterium]|nr:sn-glycerol-1-phosphate dehydrogenase [Clostridia bacterium]